MKKLSILSLALVFVLSLLTFGCGNGSTEIDYNKFTIAGKTYELSEGEMSFYGNYYSINSNNVDLWLGGTDAEIFIEMFVATSANRLVAGTYNMADNYSPLTFHAGGAFIDGEYEYYYITGGTVKIAISGTGDDAIYTITIDCTIEDEDENAAGTIKGTYRGTLEWFDESML